MNVYKFRYCTGGAIVSSMLVAEETLTLASTKAERLLHNRRSEFLGTVKLRSGILIGELDESDDD